MPKVRTKATAAEAKTEAKPGLSARRRRSTRTRTPVARFQATQPKAAPSKKKSEKQRPLCSFIVAKKEANTAATSNKAVKATDPAARATTKTPRPSFQPTASPAPPSSDDVSVDTTFLLCQEQLPTLPPHLKLELDNMGTLSLGKLASADNCTAMVAGVPMVRPEAVPDETKITGESPILVNFSKGPGMPLISPIPRVVTTTTAVFDSNAPVSNMTVSPFSFVSTSYDESPPTPTYGSDSYDDVCIKEFLGDILVSPQRDTTTGPQPAMESLLGYGSDQHFDLMDLLSGDHEELLLPAPLQEKIFQELPA